MLVTRNVVSRACHGARRRHVDRDVLAVVDDAADRAERTQRPAVGKQRVGGRDFVRRGLEYPERDRRIRARRRAGADTLPQGGDRVVAGGFGDFDGRDVARERERAPQRDRPVVLVLVVARRPRLVVERERGRLVEDDRRRRDVGAAFGLGPLERGEVDERLEDRSGLPPRADGAVVLRLVVGAAADHREDLAGARIDGDQRRLWMRRFRRARISSTRVEPVADGVLRDAAAGAGRAS